MSARGAQRASVVTARRFTSSRLRLRARNVALAPPARAKACTARTLCSRSTAVAANRPDSARASCCTVRTRRRCRTASAARTGMAASPISASTGLIANNTASTMPSRTASGSIVDHTATSASSSRPTSVVIREINSPLRVRSCQRSESDSAVPNTSSRSRAPTRSAARSAATIAAMSTSPAAAVTRTSDSAATTNSAPGARPNSRSPSMA
jgi:hypothetical protein